MTADVERATDSAATGPAPKRRSRLRITRGGVFATVVAALLIGLLLPIFSTLQPGYYERYPELRVRMASWRASTHAKMSCAQCHVDPGVTGALSFAAKAIPDFYEQLIFGPKSTNLLAVPSSLACQQCHTTARQISASGDLLIPHRAHVTVLDVKCAVCHKDLVHSQNAKGYNSPEMKTCMTCHDGEQAVDECVKCHTRKQVPDDHNEPDWLSVHGGRITEVDCASCHKWTPDYCSDCHAQLPESHAGNFKQTHQDRIKVVGQDGCFVCHDEKKFCGTCH